ncbi:MAG: mechanosensitive ion channel family protein [Candidatus Dadabacteria bacterium]|nr:mechanosensitive ion channel family protein [Candidatus Dadabacteria bacterium]NIS07676.1 mechanosensitive ion channel family protein [Candidatus Dadabacteria bacterium]NIV42255.1 mechanosensitive ion channel [Candidatus Dadabacteria bacterium]NIX14762.1 mechanosensitive ion channel [Candidatus Dadabacteria bacterium]NIY21303.1 mechanosensitive ion channel [Candidatus Dadabacteria bacterium]
MIYQLIISIAVAIVFFIFRKLLNKVIKNISEKYEYTTERAFLIKKLNTTVCATLYMLILILIWGVSIKGLSVYFASFFAIAGIALFAAWSVLSNVTSAVILFFEYPIKAGTKLKIQDGDNTIEGEVINLSLFNIEIKTRSGVVYYPNNLAIQKAIIKKVR